MFLENNHRRRRCLARVPRVQGAFGGRGGPPRRTGMLSRPCCARPLPARGHDPFPITRGSTSGRAQALFAALANRLPAPRSRRCTVRRGRRGRLGDGTARGEGALVLGGKTITPSGAGGAGDQCESTPARLVRAGHGEDRPRSARSGAVDQSSEARPHARSRPSATRRGSAPSCVRERVEQLPVARLAAAGSGRLPQAPRTDARARIVT